MRTLRGRRCPLREDGDLAVDGEKELLAVVQLDTLRPPTDVRRVDLERDPEREVLPGLDLAEAEVELAVGRVFVQRRRRESVHGVLLGPAWPKDERRGVQRVIRVDAE